ncbi:MAG: ATP-binding protein [Eggerthellaceae bacterium]|nr:ATP-binding protein [Eggerthellaceae bacterium]
MKLFRRKAYLSRIRAFYNDPEIIKVITGVRRCGKSSLMHTIAEELQESGIAEANIIFIDLDRHGYKSIKTADALEAAINEFAHIAGLKYLFIDEIQNVKDFEEVVNAYRADGDWSIFMTGSNSYLLSGELVTKLTGRYIEFEMQTLTFKEYCDMKAFLGKPVNPNTVAEFDGYILEGGFPKALYYDELSDKRTYTRSVVAEIFEKDIKRRVKIRNTSVFNQVQAYVINNFGATTSLTNMLDDLKKQGVSIKRETLNRYLQILEDAKIIRKCTRFDMKSRKSLRGEQKYYLSDLSFYFSANTDNRINYGPVLENIIYSYARNCNLDVSVGRIGNLECDFICRNTSLDYSYLQVALTIMGSKETEDREYRPLEMIKDNYPKYVVTRNDPIQHRSGIMHVNAIDFMLEGRCF